AEIKPAARKPGTTVEVTDLFETIPARKKFLKTETTERKHILRTVQRKILAHPDVRIRLLERGDVVMSVPPGTLRDRVEETLGRDSTGEMIDVDRLEPNWKERGRFGLSGLISSGETTSPHRRNQFVFVNKRPIRDPMLYRAISQAYSDLIVSDDHPAVVLFLDIPHDELDVNVHPKKEEVRFEDSQAVFRFVYKTLQNHLKQHYQDRAETSVETSPEAQPDNDTVSRIRDGSDTRSRDSEAAVSEQGDQSPSTLFDDNEDTDTQPSARVLGQFRETFVVVERDRGLFLVDQHTAHERLLYERYKRQIDRSEPAQYLSVPLNLELGRAERDVLLEMADELEPLGITIEEFGGGSLVVQTVPSYLGRRSADKRAVYGMLEEILDWEERDRLSDPGEDMVKIMACRSAVMRGDRLMPREMDELV
ncbi:MAG: DNA mismatch repair endonuclease MutL, partial [bacterium]